jgi:hypothetical protein
VPCSGARRQNKVLDEVSAAILGGVAAENVELSGAPRKLPRLAPPNLFASTQAFGWAMFYFIF